MENIHQKIVWPELQGIQHQAGNWSLHAQKHVKWRLLSFPLCYWVDTLQTVVMTQQHTNKDVQPAVVGECN